MLDLQVLDFLFTLVHLLIVGFILSGWMWKRTRGLHFYLVMATVFCWVVLGFWYGFGYCPVTDWQWQVKTRLGEEHLPNSFIKYIADKVRGQDVSSSLVDALTAVSFAVVVVIAVYLKIRIRNFNHGNYKP